MRNITLKLFSVAIALLLALFVNSESNSSVISFFVPVEIKNMPPSKTIVSPSSRQVQVSLRGPSFLVSRFAASPSTFKIRIPQDVDDRYLAALQKADLALPPDVQLVSIDPSEIEFRFDDLVERELPVVIPKIGSVGDGARLDALEVEPDRVRVTGPKRAFSQIRALETEPLDLNGTIETFSRALALRAPTSLFQVSASEVRVNVKVSPLQQQRRFDSLSVEVRASAGEKWMLSPQTVDIEVSGPKEIISNMKSTEVIPFARPISGGPREQSLAVGVETRKLVSVIVVHPSVVQGTQVSSSVSTPKTVATKQASRRSLETK